MAAAAACENDSRHFLTYFGTPLPNGITGITVIYFLLDNSCEPILSKNANVLLCGKPCAAVFLQMKLYTAHLLLDLQGHPHHWRTDCILYRFCDF